MVTYFLRIKYAITAYFPDLNKIIKIYQKESFRTE